MVGMSAPTDADDVSAPIKVVDFPVTVEDLKSYLPPSTSGWVQICVALNPGYRPDGSGSGVGGNKCDGTLHLPCFKMEHGRVAWLKCLQELTNVRQMEKETFSASPQAFHNVVRAVLKGSALATYIKCFGAIISVSSEEGDIPTSITNERVDTALYRVTCLFFPGKPGESLKYTLSTTLTKPNSMSVSTFYFYVQELISFLPLLVLASSDAGAGADADAVQFSDTEEYQLFARNVPRRWVEDFEKTKRPKTTQEIISHLQMTETIEIDRAREGAKKRTREFVL
jgi:hypothetical protein